MNDNNNNPQTEDEKLNKLEEDLKKITTEASSTVQPVPPTVPEPILQAQPSSSTVNPIISPVQPAINIPPTPNIPVENKKKGISMMTIAIVLLIIAVVVAVGYMVYSKLVTPVVVPTPTAASIQTVMPTEVPTPLVTPQSSSSASPTASVSSLPIVSPSPSASSTP